MIRSSCKATRQNASPVRRPVGHIACKRSGPRGLCRSHRVGTNHYLQIIGSNDKTRNRTIKTTASMTSTRADSLSVPKIIGTGPIMTTPPPRVLAAPLAELRITMMKASIPTPNPTMTKSKPMPKSMSWANCASSLTLSIPDIDFPRTEHYAEWLTPESGGGLKSVKCQTINQHDEVR